MRSLPMRVAAVFAALVAAFLLAGCADSADTAGAGPSDGQAVEAPVISGEPAGYNPADVEFATGMVGHHKRTVELAAMVPEHTSNPEMAALANQITATQAPEINVLNVFLVQWNENPEIGGGAKTGSGQSQSGMVDDATVARLESLHGPEFDRLWLESMIRQHRGAVEMAKSEIADGKNIDAIAMAQAMVAVQEAEIGQMQQMLEGAAP